MENTNPPLNEESTTNNNNEQEEELVEDIVKENDWVTIANAMSILGFDNKFFTRQKEIDLVHQLKLLGILSIMSLLIIGGMALMVAQNLITNEVFSSIILIILGVMIDRTASLKRNN